MNKSNFQKVIDFLKALSTEKFNFEKVITNHKVDNQGHICGTVCCAVGWFPKIFPGEVEWDWDRYCAGQISVRQTNGDGRGYIETAAKMLDISEAHAFVLFTPGQHYKVDLCIPNPEEVTPLEVAEMLEQYVSDYEDED